MIIFKIGLLIIFIGSLIVIPKVRRKIRCKKTTMGEIVDVSSYHGADDQALKGYFTYIVDGKKYKNHTGWTNYGIFIRENKVIVKYNENNPQESYITRVGLIIEIIVGIVFVLAGIMACVVGWVVKL